MQQKMELGYFSPKRLSLLMIWLNPSVSLASQQLFSKYHAVATKWGNGFALARKG